MTTLGNDDWANALPMNDLMSGMGGSSAAPATAGTAAPDKTINATGALPSTAPGAAVGAGAGSTPVQGNLLDDILNIGGDIFGGLSSGLSGLGPYLGVAGVGMYEAKQANEQNQARAAELKGLGQPYYDESQTLLNQYKSGTLSPGQQAQLQQFQTSSAQGIKDQLSRAGISDSSVLEGHLQNIQLESMSKSQEFLDDALKNSIALGQLGLGPMEQSIRLAMQSDTALAQQVNDLLSNLAKAYAYQSAKTASGGAGGGSGGGLGNDLLNLGKDLIGGGTLKDPDNTSGDAGLASDVANTSAGIGAGIGAGLGDIFKGDEAPAPTQTGSTDITQVDNSTLQPLDSPTYQEPSIPPPPNTPDQTGSSDIQQVDNSTLQPLDSPTYQLPAAAAGAGAAAAGLDALGSSALPGGVTGIGEGAGAELASQQAASLAAGAGGLSAAGALAAGDAALAADVAASSGAIGADIAAGGTGAIEAGSSTAAASTASTIGAYAGPVAALVILYTYFRPSFDAHSVTLGEPKDGQRSVQLQSGQAALATGNLAYGGGNDASQGSGQWFLMQADGTPYWIGDKNVDKIDNSLHSLGTDPQANWDKKAYFGRAFTPSPHEQLQSVYDSTGGQGAWGVDFMGWVGQIISLKSNAPGTPHE